MTALIRYEAARTALAEAHRVDEVKDIRDKAEAMAAYARQAKDSELIQYATEIKVRAERRCGELLRISERAQVGENQHTRSSNDATTTAPTLADMGLTRDESSRYQQLAAMPAEHFETAVATAKATAGEVTTAFMLREAAKHKPQRLQPKTGPLIIGLTGHAGAGKDTVADVLCSRAWRRLAFADALRVEVAAAWHIDPRMLTERATKDMPLRSLRVGNADHRDWLMYAAVQGWSLLDERSPRWVMQRWGEFRRLQNTDWWVRHVEVWLATQRRENHPGLVVTDVRMANEADMLRRVGGLLVRVHRPGAGLTASDTASHDSEGHTALQADDDIDNSGSLPDLAWEVERLLQRLLERTAAATGAAILDARSGGRA